MRRWTTTGRLAAVAGQSALQARTGRDTPHGGWGRAVANRTEHCPATAARHRSWWGLPSLAHKRTGDGCSETIHRLRDGQFVRGRRATDGDARSGINTAISEPYGSSAGAGPTWGDEGAVRPHVMGCNLETTSRPAAAFPFGSDDRGPFATRQFRDYIVFRGTPHDFTPAQPHGIAGAGRDKVTTSRCCRRGSSRHKGVCGGHEAWLPRWCAPARLAEGDD